MNEIKVNGIRVLVEEKPGKEFFELFKDGVEFDMDPWSTESNVCTFY